MTRMILGIGAALAAAIALAGCGGSANTAAGTVGATVSGGGTTTGGVAGAQTTLTGTTSQSLQQRIRHLANQIQQVQTKIQGGNIASAAGVGATVVRSCNDFLTGNVSSHANTTNARQAVSRLRTACSDVSKASNKIASGNTSAAQNLFGQAAQQAQQAVSALSGS